MTERLRPRLQAPDPMTEEQSTAAERLLKSRGHLRGPLAVWLNAPAVAIAAGDLGDVLRFRSVIPEDLKEIAILATAAHWRAEHARSAHAKLAIQAGVDSLAVEAIARRGEPKLSGMQGAVCDFARSLLETGAVGEDAYARVSSALDETQCVELVALIGYYSLVALSLNAFQISSS